MGTCSVLSTSTDGSSVQGACHALLVLCRRSYEGESSLVGKVASCSVGRP